jgi:hypothetical protein
MKRLVLAFALLTPLAGLAWTPAACGCPNCQDAIADSEDDSDPFRESRAYNHSIYLMVFMPYLLFGGLGVIMYRSAKAADRQAQLLIPAAPAVTESSEQAT